MKPDTPTLYLYQIEGIKCTRCMESIRQETNQFKSILNLGFNLSEKNLSFESSNPAEVNSYIKTLEYKGFSLKKATKDTGHSHFHIENRAFLSRLAVAGAATGNSMLAAFALYMGGDQSSYAYILSWLTLVLFWPTLFYSGGSILSSSFRALQYRQASIDTPLALAFVVGGLISTYNLVFQAGEFYFDSLTALIFFLLCTRYLTFLIRSKHLSPLSLNEIFEDDSYLLATNHQHKKREELQRGDVLLLKKGQRLPAEGRLISHISEWDQAVITGESFPVVHKEHSFLLSGSKLISSQAQIELSSSPQNSRLQDMIQELNQALFKKNSLVSLTDQGAQILTYLILLSSAAFFILSPLDFSEKLERVLALLVIACPCALAIATPLALSLAVKDLFKKSILIKDPEVFENTLKVNHVVFDKTGTLTQSQLNLKKWTPRSPNEHEQNVIHALEKESSHPIAQAFLRATTCTNPLSLEHFKETPGKGVEGVYKGQHYALKKSSKANAQVSFLKNQTPLFHASFETPAQKGIYELIAFLKEKNIKVSMLTGDNKNEALKVANLLKLNLEQVFFDQTPQSKAEKIKAFKKQGQTLMFVGDGINDGLGLALSDLSVSVKEATSLAFKAAQVHLLKSKIESLINLFNMSFHLKKNIKKNLFISFVYNISFGILALSGLITPFLTAIIMPISSLLVVGLTFLTFHNLNFKTKGQLV